jgi:hypothetical protein
LLKGIFSIPLCQGVIHFLYRKQGTSDKGFSSSRVRYGPEGVKKFRTRETGIRAMSRVGQIHAAKKGAGFSGAGAELNSA